MSNIVKTMSWIEVQDMVKAYCNSYRRKKRPKVAREVCVEKYKFVWSETYKKYYDPSRLEGRLSNRVDAILKEDGYNPNTLTYHSIW